MMMSTNRIAKSHLRAAVVLSIATAMIWSLAAPASSGSGPTVTTGKEEYFANEVVDIYGSGFASGSTYTVVVVRPDGSAVLYGPSDSGTAGEQLCYDATAADGTSCSQTVVADGDGAWSNLYQLNGVSGTYTINVYDDGGALAATTTFLDAASLAFTGSDGLPHTTSSTAENLGTVPQTVPLSLTCPRGTGLTFQGSNFGSTEVIGWSIGYLFGPADNGPTLQPLTTFAPGSGTLSGASSSVCIAPTIATSTLTVGSTYYGIVRITTSEAAGRVREFKYHFRFTVTDPPPPECIPVSYTVTWHQPIDPSSNTLNSQTINATKLGRVVPLKANIVDNCGDAVTDLSGKDVSVRVYEVSSPSSSSLDGVEQYADSGSANNDTICFRWTDSRWHYNLDTSNKGSFGALQLNKIYKAEVGIVDDTTTGCDVSGRVFADPDALLRMMR